MHYVLMIHTAEARFATRSPSEREAIMQAYGAYTKEIFATGRAGDCAALEPTPTATTVAVRSGKRVVKDGPFAETREQLGGYYVLEGSEAEALDWGAKLPSAAFGTIEIRPVIPAPGPIPKVAGAKALKEYLLLIYDVESRWASMSEAEQQSIMERYGAFSEGLLAAGQFVAGEQLDSVEKAKHLNVDGGKRVVKDGPFAETREQLGGYYRVRARDLDEAIALAAKIPTAETGRVEVRPIMDTSAYR